MPIPLFQRLPLSYKIALCFCSILILSLGTLWLLISNETRLNLRLQTDEVGETLVIQAADSVRELVLANDLLGLNVVITRLSSNSSISHITVYDVDQDVLARAGSPIDTSSIGEAVYRADIALQDAVAGSVELQLDISPLIANINNINYYFWGTLLLGVLLALALSTLLAAYLTNPINKLSEALEDPDDSNIPEEPEEQGEISRLYLACKSLLEKYQENRSHQLNISGMKHNDSTNPVSQSSKVMASLLIIKVVNVNTAIELLHPNTLSALLSEYRHYLKQAAKLYGGNVQRYTGESVMVAFDTQSCGDEHSLNAICCAQLFLSLMQNVNQTHKDNKAQALQFRLAIHSGETFFNLDQTAETLLGKSLETAYFLVKQSKPGQLLISETTYSQAGQGYKVDTADSIEITMPTDNMSFTAYILSADMNSYSALIQKQCQHILPDSD